MRQIFDWKGDPKGHVGVTFEEATKFISAGKTGEMVEKIYDGYQRYAEKHDLVVVEGGC